MTGTPDAVNIDDDAVIEATIREYLGKRHAEALGAFSGKDVARGHKCVTKVVCKDKSSWDLLECIVDEMDAFYKDAEIRGIERALDVRNCE